MNNPEYPFDINSNEIDDIVSFVIESYKSDEDEVQYLNDVIRDLKFIRGEYILRNHDDD